MSNTREIIISSEPALGKTVVVAPSLNLEFAAPITSEQMQVLLDETDGAFTRGEKTTVKELVIYDAAQGGKAAQIVLMNGHSFKVYLGNTIAETTAGSSANIANALATFGSDHTGVIGASGLGGGLSALVESMKQRGFTDLYLFRRKGGTARTLFLREPNGQATAFAKKPPYEVNAETLSELTKRLNCNVLACTGFLDYELPLVKALWSSPRSRVRVLSPHVGCFETEEGRRQCLELAKDANLFQVNEFELGRLLGYSDSWSLRDHLDEFATLGKQVGSAVVCITLAEQGSIVYDRARERVIRQNAFKVETVHNTIGAGDVHLAALIWYLWLRGRRLELTATLEVATRVCAQKIQYSSPTPRPWDGIPDSNTRKPWVREAEAPANS